LRLPAHGANPRKLYESCNLPLPERYIDFSVNTNPYMLPPSLWPSQTEFCQWAMEYPDPEARQLAELIAEMEGVSPKQLLIANGASECIYLLAKQFANKRVGILEPTFSEYRRACQAHDCDIVSLVATEERNWKYEQQELMKLIEEVDVLFLCHPNNPTGTVMKEDELYALLTAAEKAGTFVVIDEAFYPFWPEGFTAMRWMNEFSRLIVLRSLTKIHHLAGARIGYMAANETVMEKIKALQPPWSVSRIAQQLALRFLPIEECVEHAKQMIAEERKRITNTLRACGYSVSPSVVNFYLLRRPGCSTEELFFSLLKEGIVPRHTMNFPGLDGRYLRFAVKTKEENDELLHVLKRWGT
jgi:threonine-phosphate decarboxylase